MLVINDSRNQKSKFLGIRVIKPLTAASLENRIIRWSRHPRSIGQQARQRVDLDPEEWAANYNEKGSAIPAKDGELKQVVPSEARGRSGRILVLRLRLLATAHFLGLKVLVEEIEGLLVRLGAAHDGEHALASIIMGRLGDGDAGTRAASDFADLATAASDDATNHVRGDADVLGLNFFTVFGDEGDTAVAGVGVGASAVSTGLVTEVGAIASAVVGAATIATW